MLTFTITSDVNDQEIAMGQLCDFLKLIEPDGPHEAKHCDGKIGFTIGPYILFPGSFKYCENSGKKFISYKKY